MKYKLDRSWSTIERIRSEKEARKSLSKEIKPKDDRVIQRKPRKEYKPHIGFVKPAPRSKWGWDGYFS